MTSPSLASTAKNLNPRIRPSQKFAQFVEHASRANPIPTKDRIRPAFLSPIPDKYVENTNSIFPKPTKEKKAVTIFIPSLSGFR